MYTLGLLAALAGNTDSILQGCKYEYDSLMGVPVFTYVTQRPVPVTGRSPVVQALLDGVYISTDDIHTYVVVECIIDTSGETLYPRIRNKRPDEYTWLERQIIDRMRYLDCWQPAACNGVRVPYLMRLPVHICLSE